MEYLTKKKGVKFGENGMSRTNAHHHHFYLSETAENKKLINDYRKSIVKEEHR